jgi:hypothetical protein
VFTYYSLKVSLLSIAAVVVQKNCMHANSAQISRVPTEIHTNASRKNMSQLIII